MHNGQRLLVQGYKSISTLAFFKWTFSELQARCQKKCIFNHYYRKSMQYSSERRRDDLNYIYLKRQVKSASCFIQNDLRNKIGLKVTIFKDKMICFYMKEYIDKYYVMQI